MAWNLGGGLAVGGAIALLLLALKDGSWELAVLAVIAIGFVLMLSDIRDAADDMP
jgi:hypothetical protein